MAALYISDILFIFYKQITLNLTDKHCFMWVSYGPNALLNSQVRSQNYI